jgi:endo-1,4-beta-xylanase
MPNPLTALVRPLLAGSLLVLTLHGQPATPVIAQAEDAALGSAWTVASADGVTFIEPNVNFTGNFPTSADTVATFSVTFPAAGDYELYARVYVGPGGFSDDSLIPSIAFGPTAVGTGTGWTMANGLASAGFVDPDALILATGDAGSQVWKWVRLSSYSSVGVLRVPSGQLTRTYRLASREDGLRIDKLAFGPLQVTFTVDQMDKGLPGWDQRQPSDGEPYQTTGPILAHHKSKFLGSVWSGTSAYNKDFEFYWNGMWHGNAGKWGSVERVRDTMNWAVVDQGYNFAKANGVFFNFHVLLWGSQQPGWISSLPPAEQLEEIREWMQAVAARYPDIDALQVVNEPINAPPDGEGTRANYINALGGTGTTGFDWILESFRLARHYFPGTPLMINEYNVEGSPERAAEYVRIIEALQAEDLIDLIGLQGHAFSTQFTSTAVLRSNLELFASTGLPIMITEMEIDGFDDFIQLAEYQRVFPVYWEHPSVIGVNLSGHIGNWRADQGAVLVNANFTERLALQWLRTYIAGAGWPSFEGYLAERGLSPGIHSLQADVDRDGLSTGIEFLAELDPTTPDGGAFTWVAEGGNGTFRLVIAPDIAEGLVEIQTSTDLVNWATEASYDLRFRKAAGLTAEIVGGRRVLEFLSEVSPAGPRYHRAVFSRPD